MNNVYRALAITGVLCLAGCAAAPNGEQAEPEAKAAAAPAPSREVPDSRRIPPQPAAAEPEKKVAGMTFGRGIAKGPADMTFKFNVTVYEDASVDGTFSYSANSAAGTLDIEADVVCATLDNDAGRAWVGGKVTRNGSTDPQFSGQPGTEIWMRALDRNAQQMQPLVSGPLMAAGTIKNASDYCSKKPWSDEALYAVEPGALAIFP